MLLVAGYVVGVPGALLLLLRGAAPASVPAAERPPRGLAPAVGLAVATLYVVTLAPGTAMWDASEYIAAAHMLGLPHPPGNPTFVLIAHAFGALPWPLPYAARINLLAALTSAGAAACWALVGWRALRGGALPRTPRALVAAAGAWLGATAFTVWNQSVVNEKVYTLALLGVALSAVLLLAWLDAPAGSPRATGWLLLIAYLAGLGYGNHPAGFLPLPALAVALLTCRPRTLRQPRVLAAAAGALMLGLTVFLYQPIRAAHRPPLNVGVPTACPGAPALGCTFSAETLRRVLANVSREQYGGHEVGVRRAPLGAQVGMWWLYFRWQWWRDLAGRYPVAQGLVAACVLGLALAGAALHARRDRESFAVVGPLLLTLTPALIIYLNFRYGASQAPELGEAVPREVRDRDYFFLWSFSSLAVWVSIGLGGAWQGLARLVGRGGTPRWAATAPLLALTLLPMVANADAASRRAERFTAAWARDLLRSVAPGGVLVTNGDNDSFPVWYAQEVEGVRRDVLVVVTPYLNTAWYPHELHQPTAHGADGASVFGLSTPEIDAVPPLLQLDQPARVSLPGCEAMLAPGVYARDQLLVLHLLRTVAMRRPVHFAVGPYPQQLGLSGCVVIAGLTQRYVPRAAHGAEAPALAGRQTDPVQATLALWRRFDGPAALVAQRRWTDAPSASIPAAYVATARWLAEALAARGDSVTAHRLQDEGAQLARTAGLVR
jgi:hypothetical protein